MARSRDSGLSLGLFALLLSIYLLTFSGRYHSSDEMSMLAVTDSLARRGAWDIELLRWMGEQQGSFGPDGQLYSRKGIGMTLAALPHYWLALHVDRLGNVQTAMLTNAITTALTGVLVYLILRQLAYSRGLALAAGLAFGLATMAWPYARYLFSESLASLGLMISFYFLVRYGVNRTLHPRAGSDVSSAKRGAEGGQWICPLLAGTGVGVALLARLNNAIAALFLGLLLVAYIYRHHGSDWRAWVRPIILFGLPVLAALAIIAWYNWLRFGHPLNTGYLPEERFSTPFLEGFYGLTLSPGKGLFWYNPLLFAALIAWPAFFRRHRAEALLVGAVMLSNIAFYASWFLWWAGHSWGPRFLVTILPFAALPLAPALEATGRRRGLASALIALAVISITAQLLGVAVDFDLYLGDIYTELGLYHPATLFDPAYSPLLQQISYLQPENLDLAWARGGSIDWLAFLASLALCLASALTLWAAWHRRSHIWARAGLLTFLGLGALVLLVRYAPGGDIAGSAHALAAMERPGEVAALTDSARTGAWQDAYDGQLWVWGVPSRADVGSNQATTWVIGDGDPDPAVARFQVGALRLDYFAPPGEQFDAARLPASPLETEARLGNAVELVATELGATTIRQSDILQLGLYWRALAPMELSYTVFVQAIDEQGIKAGQIDRRPCHGRCPTTGWRPGDLVGERYDLPIRSDAPPGRYQIIAGMYDPATAQNLLWLDAQGNAVSTYVPLGLLEVQPEN